MEVIAVYAIEFETTIKNGIIEIPEAYRGRIQQRVRVILLGEEATTPTTEQHSIADVLANAPGQRLVYLDCATGWLSNIPHQRSCVSSCARVVGYCAA
jgi:hypothetical protein